MKPSQSIALISLLFTTAHAMNEKSILFTPESLIEVHFSELHQSKEKENQFWEALFTSEQPLIVIGELEEKKEEKNRSVILHTWEQGSEPTTAVFTSLKKLNEALDGGTPYLELDAKTLLTSIEEQGYAVYINPRYTKGVHLSSSELKRILSQYSKPKVNLNENKTTQTTSEPSRQN